MSSPLETAEFETLYVGNTHDDDGPVLDSLVKSVDAPAELQITAIDATPLIEPVGPNQLIAGTQFFDFANLANITPTQILPADTRRKSVTLSLLSTAASPAALVEYVTLADSNGKTRSSLAYNLRHGKDPLVLDGYTGEIWAYPSASITASVELTWVAITE